MLFGCLKGPQWWREHRASRSPLPIKRGNRWKQKNEISNSLLSHTHALALAVSQKNTHILQIVLLKNTILNMQNRGYIVYTWNCLVRCQLVYAAELFFEWKCVPNASWECTTSIRTEGLKRYKNSPWNSLKCRRMVWIFLQVFKRHSHDICTVYWRSYWML